MTSRTQNSSNAKTLLIWLGGAVAVIGLVAVVISGAGGSSGGADHPDLQGDPVVTGDFLQQFPSTGVENSAGSPVPEVSGVDFDGNPVSIVKNGKPKMLLFLAHWCPHCRDEVPEVQAYLETNTIPDEVDFISVATSIDRGRVNFPPSSWLEGENWSVPVILDSAGSEAYVAYGAGAFPFWAMVDADGNLITRVSGAGQVDLAAWSALLADSVAG
ncbi:MAG: TlpA family protein disulfide reductase [Acidimicrobiia bacterium]|nr:TlpA family protein disulfide reductase [Acidimicrobiia bacterium]